MKAEQQTKLSKFIRELMPNGSDEEQLEAEDRFLEFLKLIGNIQKRVFVENHKELDSLDNSEQHEDIKSGNQKNYED